MNSHITVRVGRLPGRIGEFTLNGDRTVATALATAGLDATGYEIRVQGRPATPETTLIEGDLVLLVKKIKGNADGFTLVRVGRVPGPALVEVAITEATVGAALEAAGITLADDGENVFQNDWKAYLVTAVADGDRIIVKAAPKAQPEPSPEPGEDNEEVEPSFEDRLEELTARAAGLRAQAEADSAEADRIEAALTKYHDSAAEIDELLDIE